MFTTVISLFRRIGFVPSAQAGEENLRVSVQSKMNQRGAPEISSDHRFNRRFLTSVEPYFT